MAAEYRCERDDLFIKLADVDWFAKFIEYQYRDVVFSMEPIGPVLSDYWIRQAHYRWAKDIKVVSGKEYEGRPLDHFKYSGFLCYWLRRCPTLCDLYKNPDVILAGIRSREPKEILIRKS